MKRIYISLLLIVASVTICVAKPHLKQLSRRMQQTMHAQPASCTDMTTLKRQYQINQAAWDSVISWVSSHDIQSMPAGKYYVCDTIRITVQDATTRAVSKIEGHQKYIDFQWTIQGTEVFHLFDMKQVEEMTPYNEKKDVRYFTELNDESPMVLRSTPAEVYIFFPSDPHRALLQDGEPMPIRKIVAKIPYVE